jgi:DNA repair photolyase
LWRELGKPAWLRERVALGTATDAYQPCEGRYRLTRRCLEALHDHATPVSIVTKSTLIVRDLDLVSQLAQGPGATVYFTITTLDPELWRLLEPGTPPPSKRLGVMQQLSGTGIPCGVFLAPILPGLTDSAESIEAVAAAAKAHGALTFGSGVLRLAPMVKAHYFDFVAANFPALLPRYERAYGGSTISTAYQRAIEQRLNAIREQHGFRHDAMHRRVDEAKASTPIATPGRVSVGQLALPL